MYLVQAPAVIENSRPPGDWPSEGRIVLENYCTRYRPGLDLVLHDVSCEIKAGERVSHFQQVS